jgi:hypothetical protein
MSFEWLNKFVQESEKPANYAEKTLKAYQLGMKAKGSIQGVRIVPDPDGCPACRSLEPTTVHLPEEAPHVPLPGCDRAAVCGCVYRPVMSYQTDDDLPEQE